MVPEKVRQEQKVGGMHTLTIRDFSVFLLWNIRAPLQARSLGVQPTAETDKHCYAVICISKKPGHLLQANVERGLASSELWVEETLL